MLQLSDFAISKQAEVISDLVKDGFMRLYSGEQPPLKVRTDGRLCDCKIISAVINGAAITISWESSVATKEGSADYFRIVTSGNIPVLSGKIGNSDDYENAENDDDSKEDFQMEMTDRVLKVGTIVYAGILVHHVFKE